MTIRLKVKDVAKQKGISQAKLSRLADLNISTVQLIYRKPLEANITLITLDRIAKALGVDVRELLESVPDE
jgi:DNA-binding Xre family transcriptional regulator